MNPEMTIYTEESIEMTLSDILQERQNMQVIPMESLKRAVITLLNRLQEKARFNANISICAETQEVSNLYGEVLGKCIEQFLPDSYFPANEDELYRWNEMHPAYRQGCVWIVKDFEAKDPDKLYTTLTEIEKEGWSPSVILCMEPDTMEKLKAYDTQDYRLFYYLCGYKIVVPGIDQSNVTDLAFRQLEQEMFTLTDGFRKKLGTYIQAVYPEAALTKERFLKDLIERIYQVHYQKIAIDRVLDESDVPYSKKAEELEQQAEAAEEPEVTEEKEEKVKWLPDINFFHSMSEADTDAKKTAIFLNFLTPFNPEKEEIEYKYKTISYYGIATNDAPIQLLIKKAYDDGCSDFHFLCIVSKASYLPIKGRIDGKNTYTRFCELVKTCIDGSMENQSSGMQQIRYDFHQINYDFRLDTDGNVSEVDNGFDKATYVFSQIKSVLGDKSFEDQDKYAYVDYTGGMRDISLLMIVILRYLQFTNIQCQNVVYGDISGKIKRIVDIQYIYDLMELISGTDAFTRDANAEPLTLFFKEETDEKTKELLEAVKRFSQFISICDIRKMDSSITKINDTIMDFERQRIDGLNETMLNALIPTVKSKLFLDQNLVRDSKIDYPLLIQWCIENNFLQQAATLYTEKMPVYYFDAGILSDIIDINEVTESTMASSKEYTGFYTDLYELAFRKMDRRIDRLGIDLKSRLDSVRHVTKNNVLSILESVPEADPCKKACSNIYDFICECFDSNGYQQDYHQIYGERVGQSSLEQFMNALASTRNDSGIRYRHFFLFDDAQDYQRYIVYAGNRNEETKDKTLRKKIMAVDTLFLSEITTLTREHIESLQLMMSYYLAVKMLRNMMNHANEEEETEVEQEVRRKLNEYHLPGGRQIEVDLDYDKVKKLLWDAVEFRAELKPITWTGTSQEEVADKNETSGETVSDATGLWQDIELPQQDGNVSSLGLNSEQQEKVRETAQKVIWLFRAKRYPSGGKTIPEIKEDASEIGGLAEKRELGKGPANCLKTAYPTVFSIDSSTQKLVFHEFTVE